MSHLDNDVIGLGFRRGEYFHLVATAAGLTKIPAPYKIEKPTFDGYMDVFIAATKPHMVALVLAGYITPGDANKCLEGPFSSTEREQLSANS